MYAFGAGNLYTVPGVANPTPNRFGAVQQIGVDFNANTVNLFGAYQFPLASARGTVKIDGSGKFAQIAGQFLNSVFFANSTLAAGTSTVADLENGTVTSSAVTVANSANWTSDLGVINPATGAEMIRISSSGTLATGQYQVAAGVYTFFTDMEGLPVQITYIYSDATAGETLTMKNALMGVAAAFQAVFMQTYNAQQSVLTLNKAIAAKFTIQSALEDFTKPDFSFAAFADDANNIGTWAFAQAS